VSSFQVGFCSVKRSPQFDPRPLAFPQREGIPNSIFLAVKASALDGVFDKRHLVGGNLYFHRLQRRENNVWLSGF
jgi:hypothetical protein